MRKDERLIKTGCVDDEVDTKDLIYHFALIIDVHYAPIEGQGDGGRQCSKSGEVFRLWKNEMVLQLLLRLGSHIYCGLVARNRLRGPRDQPTGEDV
ncbi:hypothetical protein Tco_0607842 [Tanacetum coccineum]